MLFESRAEATLLPAGDPRAEHVRKVLRMRPGDRFDVGLVDGPRGKALIEADGPDGLHLRFEWGSEPPPTPPLRLLVGLSRPQTMRKILREAAPLGIAELHLARCDKGEPAYASSTLWTDGEWREQLLQGAEQAFTTRLPRVLHHHSLSAALETVSGGCRIALDNYEAALPLHRALPGRPASVALAIGPERGWSAAERDALRATGWTLAHMGPLVLRTETAVIAACAVALPALGAWEALDVQCTVHTEQ